MAFVKGSSGFLGKHHTEETKLKMKPTQFKKGFKSNLGRKWDISSVQKQVNTKRLNGVYELVALKHKERLEGKSYEDLYGKEKADNIIKKRSIILGDITRKRMSNKSYEEIYGKEKAIDVKRKIGLKSLGRIPANKNKTYEEFFGDDEAKRLRTIIKENRKKQIFPMKDTKIELKIQKFLIDLKIEFIQHYYTSEIEHSYQCDILIPVQKGITQKTIIECDGDYWHSNPIKYPNPNKWQKEQIEEDEIRTKELIKQGFRVIRLWENKIKQINLKEFKEVVFI